MEVELETEEMETRADTTLCCAVGVCVPASVLWRVVSF
jgi:hypothetical protein